MPIVIGHRGAAAHVLENTAASFAAAVRFGARMIEFDVHESLDGEFIVIHDTHLGRISTRRDVVCQTHSHLLTTVELNGGHRLLTLAQAFAVIPETVGIMVEIKAIRSFHKLANLVQRHARKSRVAGDIVRSHPLAEIAGLRPIAPSRHCFEDNRQVVESKESRPSIQGCVSGLPMPDGLASG